MPEIRKSADLRNNYGAISQFCHQYKEPVFITKNGVGDLAVMSIDAYNELSGRMDLYTKKPGIRLKKFTRSLACVPAILNLTLF